jgi:predicted TPR repeat methyltransferase
VVSEELTVWIGEFERAATVPKSFSVCDQEFRRLLDRFYLPAVPDPVLSVALFDLCAEAYERLVDVTRNVANIHNLLRVALVAWQGEFEPVRVLDFGCGTGLSVAALQSFISGSARRIQLTGTDGSAHMLQIAARRGLPVLAKADWASLPAGTYDAVIASYVFHLGISQDDCDLIAKQLTPGGVLVANYHRGDASGVARTAALLSRAGLRAIPLPADDAGTPANPILLFG